MTTLLAKPSAALVLIPHQLQPKGVCSDDWLEFVAMVWISVPKRSPCGGLDRQGETIVDPPEVNQNSIGGWGVGIRNP
jgi:hypothetical protein